MVVLGMGAKRARCAGLDAGQKAKGEPSGHGREHARIPAAEAAACPSRDDANGGKRVESEFRCRRLIAGTSRPATLRVVNTRYGGNEVERSPQERGAVPEVTSHPAG